MLLFVHADSLLSYQKASNWIMLLLLTTLRIFEEWRTLVEVNQLTYSGSLNESEDQYFQNRVIFQAYVRNRLSTTNWQH